MSRKEGFCDVKGCGRPTEYIYYRKEVCGHHWELHCKEKGRFDLKKAFGIKEEEPITVS